MHTYASGIYRFVGLMNAQACTCIMCTPYTLEPCYENQNIHKIPLKIINILILYNTYVVRMCIHNVTVVLVLMHI